MDCISKGKARVRYEFGCKVSMAKGSDLSAAIQAWVNDIAWQKNGRLRKTFGWKTPAEAMADK